MIDTRHFDADFTARLLEALGDLDEKTDGVLFHSENFQALNLMQARYWEKVKCVYIDPPYNTGTDDFIYRDNYQFSSWATMIAERIGLCYHINQPNTAFLASIDDTSLDLLRSIYQGLYGRGGFVGCFVWRRRVTSSLAKSWVSTDHEYVLAFSRDPEQVEIAGLERDQSKYNIPDGKGGFYASMPLTVGMNRTQRPNQWYELKNPKTGTGYWPPQNRVWAFYPRTMEQKIADDRIIWPEDYPDREMKTPRYKAYAEDAKRDRKPVSTWMAERGKETQTNDGEDNGYVLEVGKNEEGTRVLKSFFGEIPVIFPKPVSLLHGLLQQFLGENGDVLDFFAGSGTTGHAVINLNREDGGRRKFILVEMADYFDTMLLPRLKKVAFTPEWKDGKPKRPPTAEEIERGPRVFKIVRLESYEDTLNNLEVKRTPQQQSLLDQLEAQGPDKLREQYLLQYLLKVETRGSPSLLNVAAFSDPTAYRLKVKRPGSDESREVCVDLIETFNWLLGLTVTHLAALQVFTAEFKRDSEKRLRLKGRLVQLDRGTGRQGDSGKKASPAVPPSPSPAVSQSPSPPVPTWWFRTVTGTMPDGRKALVIWRKLTGNPEEDNLVLDEWFTKQGYSSKDSEFDLIYVNGDNNLENLKTPDDTWKVRLIEDDFQRLMFAGEGV
jgi:adenine-specific DNA-methyltransferase